jgi:hypothetical protein
MKTMASEAIRLTLAVTYADMRHLSREQTRSGSQAPSSRRLRRESRPRWPQQRSERELG